MPELPEVETVMRGVRPALDGLTLDRVEARRPDLRWPLPERFAERLTGRRVLGLARRSKYILIELEGGESWLVHLGMSGRVAVFPRVGAPQAERLGAFLHAAPSAEAAAALGPHDHVVVDTAAARLVYTDARRFGAMDLAPTDALAEHKWLARLGPEPLGNGFHAEHLAARFAGRVASVKAQLLDQTVIAGLGNIYVCEALWRAGVSPLRAAGAVEAEALERLAAAVRAVLAEAIEAGGSSLRDHRQVDGELGYFQHRFAVYGRAGEPCARPTCRGEVVRVPQNGRSSFYCEHCQA